ncbi:MAG: hypothetical protein ACRETY_01750 [Steroidobacteraceae bacterium]
MAKDTTYESTSKAGTPSGFDQLGVVPVVNACGIYTDLGGSILSESVWSALTDLNRSFVDLHSLLERSGEEIATLVGAESARVTPGASAAIVLALAACIVSRDSRLGERLPQVEGLKGEIVMQRRQAENYKYGILPRLTGAKVVLAGDSEGTTRAHFERAISARTGALFAVAHLDTLPGCVPLEEMSAVARSHDLPLVVDAAYMSFPPETMRTYSRRGANLTCFSAKYFRGPNAGGFVAGDRSLIEAVRGMEFTAHEQSPYQKFGRAFKMGRYEIAAVVLALHEWFAMDHSQRLARYAHKAGRIAEALRNCPAVSVSLGCFTLGARLADFPVNAAILDLRRGSRVDVASLLTTLASGNPSVRAVQLEDRAVFVTETLNDGEEELVARRILDALS